MFPAQFRLAKLDLGLSLHWVTSFLSGHNHEGTQGEGYRLRLVL